MSYQSQLASLATQAKEEAVIAQMTCDGYEWDGHTFSIENNYGESYDSRSVTLDGQASGYSYNIGAGNDDPALAQLALDDLNNAKTKWNTNIDELLSGWDALPEPGATWDGVIASLQAAAKQVAGPTGNDNSALGNPDLTEIGFIRDRLPTNIGVTVDTFYRIYGPDRLELVLDGHCEAMACLGVALEGEKRIWERAQADVLAIMTAADDAFKETRQNNSTNWSTTLSVVTAGIGLLAAFTAGVPGVAPVLAAAGATTGFLGTAMSAIQAESSPRSIPEGGGGDYSGSHPDDVYDDLVTAFRTLDDTIADAERGIESMLDNMTAAIASEANRQNFHINPDAGLDPTYAGSDDIIDMEYSILETIGYTSMPLIARAFLTSVDNAEAGKRQEAWVRPFASKIGSTIGMGSYGPYFAWQELLYAIFPLANDTAAEIVAAGEKLATAAGYVRDSDSGVRQTLGANYQDIQDAELGWQAPHTDPVPTPPPYAGRGKPIPI